MLETKEITLENKTYVLSKIPAVPAREIAHCYITTILPKVGDYKANELIMFKMFKYVSVVTENGNIALVNEQLINNHVPNWEILKKIEHEMIAFNCSFFQDGSEFQSLRDLVTTLPQLITKTLRDFSQRLSPTTKPATTN